MERSDYERYVLKLRLNGLKGSSSFNIDHTYLTNVQFNIVLVQNLWGTCKTGGSPAWAKGIFYILCPKLILE